MYVQAKLPPSIHRISNMYVYSNFVKLSSVGNRQIPIMGLLPINSKFKKSSNWVFNRPIYVSVREQNIKTIILKILTVTGEELPILGDVVTCLLNFRC